MLSSNRSRMLLISLLVFMLGAVFLGVAVFYQVLGLPTSLSVVNGSVTLTVTGAPGTICIGDVQDQIYECTSGISTYVLSNYGVQNGDTLIFNAYPGSNIYFQQLLVNGVVYCQSSAQVAANSGVNVQAVAYFSYQPAQCQSYQTTTTVASTTSQGQVSTMTFTTVTTAATYTVYSPTTITTTASGATSTIQSTFTSFTVSTVTVTTSQSSTSGFILPQILLGALGVGLMGVGGGSALVTGKRH